MSEVAFTRDISCRRDRIRELLSDPEFLTAFVRLQNPVEDKSSVTSDEPSSTMEWGVSTEGIPGIFRRFVDETIPIKLAITCPGTTPDQDGSMHLELKGKVSGELRVSLSLLTDNEDPARTTMKVLGPLDIHIGFLSRKASDMARDHMIIPILLELADLLEQWCTGPRT